MAFSHEPVMPEECLAALNIHPKGIYLDGTAGGGGHSRLIAERLTEGHLYALDQDPEAIRAAAEKLRGLPATLILTNFRDARRALRGAGVEELYGALLDLGVSSHQLDTPHRGFSYHSDAPLDMRMGAEGQTAADLLATLGRDELSDILRRYGEEPYAWQIAGRIVAFREREEIKTTGQLADIVRSAVPPAVRRRDKNPARRTFQALRIAVNGELEALEEGLGEIFSLLKPGARLAVVTFHSLEDRIVKQRFRKWATACTCPPDFPVCTCGGVAAARLVGRQPLVPAPEEQARNRRSRSAKLRTAEKI